MNQIKQNKTTRTGLKRWFTALILVSVFGFNAMAQNVTVTGGTTAAGSYPTFAAAISAVNGATATGAITVTINAGYSETAPATGFIVGSATLNPTLSATNTLTINKTGGTVTLNAGVGTSTPGSAAPDGIISVRGADHVIIDGLTLTDGNTTNPATMEFGIGFFKLSVSDGCNNNTVQNCTINMQRINNASGTAPMIEGAVGILFVNSVATAATTALTPTNGGTLATNGTNSGNKVYSNSINGGNYGIGFSGFAATAGVGPTPTATTFLGDLNNDIGGSTPLQGNTILNFGGGAATNPAAGIRANNQWGVNISYNTINNNNGSGVNHATTLRGIYAQAGTSANATISNNTITVKSAATTSACTAIDNAIGSTGASNTVTINNNNVSGCTYTTATTGTFTGILTSSTATNVITNNNIINNNTIGNVGTASSCIFQGIYSSGSATNYTANGNTITNNVVLNQGGTLYSLRGSTSLLTWNNNIINNNGFSNHGGTLSASVYGLYDASSPTQENFANNQIDNLYITGNSTSSGSNISGILVNTSASSNKNFTGNTIHTLTFTNSSTGSCTINGITQSLGTTVNVSKNKIYNLSAQGAASIINGINLSSGTTINISNNYVGDLTAPNATGLIAIRGLNFPSTGTVSSNVSFNTIYLNATSSSATTFGTACIQFSSTATNTLNLRNNILVNLSTPAQEGLNVATNGVAACIMRTSGTPGTVPTNYLATSNTNAFWCNPAAGTNNHLTYTEGTTTVTNPMNTLALMKLFMVNRDQASVSENPNFVSTTGSSSNFLHINTGIPTQIESSATPIAGVTDDFDGDTRNVTTPDIGADEFAGIASDITGPAISYTLIPSSSCLSNITLSATITDASLVNTAPGTKPRMYFKKSTDANTYVGNTSADNGWKYVEATNSSSPFSFTTDYSILQSAVVASDVIEYFVVAQDLAGTPNVGINSGSFTTTPASVALGVANFPIMGIINSYTVMNSIPTTVTIGAAGTYPTLTGVGGLFEAINNSALSGNTVATILDASITEPGTVALNQINYGCTINTLTISPLSTTTLTGSVAAGSIIKLNGADYVIIDGSNSGGTDRSLTIQNTTTTTTGNAVVWLASPAIGNGSTNNIIKNCVIEGNSSTTSFTGIHIGGSTSIGLTTAGTERNSNNTIQNNLFRKTQYGVIMFGFAAATPDLNNVITQNNFGTATAGEGFSLLAINADRQQNLVVSYNEVQNVRNATNVSSTPYGGIRLLDFKDGQCYNNYIHDLDYTGTSTPKIYGIAVTSSSYTTAGNPSNGLIYNNTVSRITSTGTSAVWNLTGILASAGYGDKFYHNTVHLTGQLNNSTSGFSAAFANGDGNITSVCTNIDVRNNIFNVEGSSLGGNVWAYYSAATTLTGSTLNYNNLRCAGTGATNNIGRFNSVNYTSLSAWQTATGQEANSVSIAPVFLSNTNLHLDLGSNSSLDNLGTPLASVTLDIDGTTRSITSPDMGADEFTSLTCSGAVGGTASGSTSLCNSGTPTITASGYSIGSGSGYQWMSSTNAGDYPLAGTAVSGQTNPATLTTGVVSTTTYYWLRVTCATNSSTDYSNMITITVNPSAASISGASSKCANDPAVTLTENGGTGTSWLWSTSETTQSISVNPSSTTTYTVTVTSPGSCTATATKTVTVNPNPTGVTASSDLSTICNGTSINLTSSANSPSPTILTQNFESGIGSWVITAASTGGATPTLANFNIRAHGWSSGGSTPVVMNSPGATNFIFADPDGAGSGVTLNTQLTSPSFSTVGYTAASLDFRHYYRHITTAQTVQISTDGGTVWTTLQTYSATVGTPTAFASAAISLNAYLGLPNVKIRFNYTGGWIWYWAIDDISITGTPASYSYSWTSTPSGFTSAVQNPTGVTPTVSTDYTVTVTASNGCTASASTGVVTVNNYPVADAPANVTACDSYVLPALSVGNYFSGSGGTGTAYSAGNTISASMTMYVYAETGTTPNCTDENSFTITINNTPVADAPANVTACDSYVLPALSVGNYFSGSGGTGTAYSAGNTISASMTMYVYAETGTTPNCIDENSFTITINNTPVADAPANVTACDSYVLPALSVGNYFSGSGGTGTAYSAGNTITSSMTMYVYAETGTTPNCTDENSFTITINNSPTATISGDAAICAGGSTNLTLNFTGTAPWTYAINGGSSVSTSNNPETVSVTPGATTVYSITSLSDANCTGSGSGTATVTVSPAAPDFIITFQPGPVSACVGNTVNLTLNPVNNAATYTWSAPAGTLINGQVSPVTTTSNSVTLTLGAVPANGSGWNICVFASNPCGNSQTKCAFIRGALSTPAAITGDKTACPNTSGTYSTSAVAGANSYLWTGTNGITFTGSGTSVTANFPAGFTTGTICVAAQLSCGYTGPSRCLTVTNNVGTLGVMSGAFAVCPGQTGLVFSVPPVTGAATYNWTTPTGVTITSGAGTNSVTVNVGGTFTVGNICVTATSICGVVSAPRCKTISSIKPGTPGNISGSATGVCNSTVTYSVPAVAGVTSYNWTLPSGASFATANGTNTVDVTFSNSFTTGQLCVTAVNGCGASTARCINVKGAPAIPGVISAPGVICANEQGTVFSVNPVFGTTTYTWVIPATATLVAGQGTNSIVVDWGATGGLVTVTASNGCGNSGTRTYLVTLTCRSASTELPGVNVSAYPNPVSSTLTVAMDTPSEGNFSMMMTDLTGRVMFEQQLKAVTGLNETAVDVSNLAKGIYMLTVKNENGFTKQIRVTVQ